MDKPMKPRPGPDDDFDLRWWLVPLAVALIGLAAAVTLHSEPVRYEAGPVLAGGALEATAAKQVHSRLPARRMAPAAAAVENPYRDFGRQTEAESDADPRVGLPLEDSVLAGP